jgi:hypothetical protein
LGTINCHSVIGIGEAFFVDFSSVITVDIDEGIFSWDFFDFSCCHAIHGLSLVCVGREFQIHSVILGFIHIYYVV